MKKPLLIIGATIGLYAATVIAPNILEKNQYEKCAKNSILGSYEGIQDTVFLAGNIKDISVHPEVCGASGSSEIHRDLNLLVPGVFQSIQDNS